MPVARGRLRHYLTPMVCPISIAGTVSLSPGANANFALAGVSSATTGLRSYSAELGRWINRDPIGERGGAGIYAFLGNRTVHRVDYLGLAFEECEFCGPDMTHFLRNLINGAISWRNTLGTLHTWQTHQWLLDNGGNLDWWSSAGQPYRIAEEDGVSCPSGEKCKNTYWLCGECVHDHWIGNFMFGFLGRLFGVSDTLMDFAAGFIQGSYSDPPWDVAGYEIARNTNELMQVQAWDLCVVLQAEPALWDQANDTSATGGNFPVPHAKDYSGCKKCPKRLPMSVQTNVPGGKFGGGWPPMSPAWPPFVPSYPWPF